MASAKTHMRKRSHSQGIVFAVGAFAVIGVISLVLSLTVVGNAQGSGEVDASVIGVGSEQRVVSGEGMSAEERITGASAHASNETISLVAAASEEVDPRDTAQRSITVKDPDPVIAAAAVDMSNPEAVKKAKEVCTIDPLPTAPRIQPDVHDGTWQSGMASAYDVVSNDDGKGNFGVNTTASGVALHAGSVTVAVPASQASLLGRVVEICYAGKVVIATVTDTGGFAQYGRALDLAPGVYTALGASSPQDWGVRAIYYRFL